MNADTGQMAKFTEELGGLGGHVQELDDDVSEMTAHLVQILDAVIPILKTQVRREIEHRERTVSIRHTGRHRRGGRRPPWCGDDQ